MALEQDPSDKPSPSSVASTRSRAAPVSRRHTDGQPVPRRRGNARARGAARARPRWSRIISMPRSSRWTTWPNARRNRRQRIRRACAGQPDCPVRCQRQRAAPAPVVAKPVATTAPASGEGINDDRFEACSIIAWRRRRRQRVPEYAPTTAPAPVAVPTARAASDSAKPAARFQRGQQTIRAWTPSGWDAIVV